MEKEIKLKKAILHILDGEAGMQILSQSLLDTTEVEGYVEKHISKAIKDENIKDGYVGEGSPLSEILNKLSQNPDDFVTATQAISNMFFDIVINKGVPAGDVLVADYTQDNQRNIMILKMNYKRSYIHYVENSEGGISNKIICQPVSLPSEGQKVDEFINIEMATGKVLFKEKKYEIEGNPEYYISKYIIKNKAIASPKEQLKTVYNAISKVAEEYFPGDIEKIAEAREEVIRSYNERKAINVKSVGERLSGGIESIKKDFSEQLQEKGMPEQEIVLNENLDRQVNKKHKIITEDGVEIKLPNRMFGRKDKMEIINNPDGTISILIKNIEIV